MEQVPNEQVKACFDRVLTAVQKMAREKVKKYTGQVMEVLVEEINDGPNAAETLETLGSEGGEVLLTGRMSNNTLVHFPGQPSLVGQLIDVKLLVCQGFYYLGRRQ